MSLVPHAAGRLALTAFARLALAASFTLAATTATVALAAAPKPTKFYAVHNLVSNGVLPTPYFDANMVNTWGVSFNPAGLVWVTNNRSGTSTLYDGLGVPQSLVVNVPPATVGGGVGSPTGIVFSGGSDFVVGNGVASGPSRFIFASDDGLISGWAPNVDLTNALRVVVSPNADYKGLAVASAASGSRLYAADFRNGRVDVFDGAFNKIAVPGRFVDPKLPRELAPFGIQAIGDRVYVTFAKKEGGGSALGAGDEAAAAATPAQGGTPDSAIDIFDLDGRFVRRAAADIGLKQPWGVALAPADFGVHSNRLLVSDFHDGSISAYDQNTGKFLGYLNDARGQALKVPGIWGIQFGNGINSQPLNTLFFGAGPNGQGGGVYGSVTAGKGS